MFPNDQICNEKAAKRAAQRLFEKYKSPSTGLGQNEVSSLMKDTYAALNMNYNPDKEDVNGFMGVMDFNRDGSISLEDLQSMALKYLCGTQLVNLNEYKKQQKIAQQKQKSISSNQLKKLSQSQTAIQQKQQSSKESQYYMERVKYLFESNQNPQFQGITIKQAGKILQQTYQLFGKNHFPKKQQITTWIQEYDEKGNGIITQQQYQRFASTFLSKQ